MGQTDLDAKKMPAVPLFPLPNVVLFPGAVLPLHLFEERYKLMVADSLRGDKTIAMALLCPGWERSYHQRPAIEQVVCAGTILSHERLADGCYNLLLRGTLRANIVREYGDRPYRLAVLQPLAETAGAQIELVNLRQRMMEIFMGTAFAATVAGRQFQEILAGPMGTARAADLAAFNLLEDVGLKQQLLAETNIIRRVQCVVRELERLCPLLDAEAKAEWN